VTDVTARRRRLVHMSVHDWHRARAMSLTIRITAFLILSAISSAVLMLPYLSIQ
jgi:hypothetical protein